ncbi:MAG: tRNA (guanosine(37)-N1)-methyltransferase TrmD [Deltaproteobacteria bacterium]|nr:tRNA (guanosine(37)-N1)-methyltransferase TrmD [Deltaproteobacteria bacterium]
MRFDVVTLFPEMFSGLATLGVVGRAVASGEVSFRFRSPRDFGLGRHQKVDDTPYGGGAGMVMRVDCIVSCLESLDADAPCGPEGPLCGHRVLMTPRGRRFDQRRALELAALPAITLICGRYEGVDERIRGYVDEELSLGDFVLSGGELAAMAIVDAVSRLQPGVLGNPESLASESHSPLGAGLLEYPQYTRPPDFRGATVPEVLLGGNHAAIEAWRRAEAEAITEAVRPDLTGRRSSR